MVRFKAPRKGCGGALPRNQDEEHVVKQLGRIEGTAAGLECLIEMLSTSELGTRDQWDTLKADIPKLLKSWPSIPVPELLHDLTALIGGSAQHYQVAYVSACAGVIQWSYAHKAKTSAKSLRRVVARRDDLFSRLRLDPELRGPQRTAAFWDLVASTSAAITQVT